MKKRRRKKDEDEARRKARRQMGRKVLTTIGLADVVKDTTVEERFLTAHYPTPTVTLPESLRDDVQGRRMLQLSTRATKQTRFHAPVLGKSFLAVDYFTTVKPQLDLLANLTSTNQSLNEAIANCRQQLAELAAPDTAAFAAVAIVQEIDEVLIKFGRIDTRLYSVEIRHCRNERQQFVIEFQIKSHSIEKREVIKNGEKRRAFRCGQPYGIHGVEWLEWDGELIGGPAGTKFPVFVQSHALDNLYRREARALFIEDGEWLVHDYLWQSLRRPKLIPMSNSRGKYLVEYWLNAHKIGYLVVSLADGVVLVETFLFLTMNGTPEGDCLRQKLKFGIDEKKYSQIDRIQTFLFSDIQHDVELRALLGACGCGHLFEILKEPPPPHRSLPGYAEDVRKLLPKGIL